MFLVKLSLFLLAIINSSLHGCLQRWGLGSNGTEKRVKAPAGLRCGASNANRKENEHFSCDALTRAMPAKGDKKTRQKIKASVCPLPHLFLRRQGHHARLG
jgi:hypothetical protein